MSFFNRLKFIKKQRENDDVWTFSFSRPVGLKHKAGQHGLFVIPGLYRPHPFTLSSAPEEEYVTISTHIDTGSNYKKKLMSMKAGDAMILLGPILNFTLNDSRSSVVFLAQGVGITPFRSMLVDAHTKALPVHTTLIHVDNKKHTFRDETNRYTTKAYYPTDAHSFGEIVKKQENNALFYLSGSPKFVSATRTLLKQQGVRADSIKTDSFLGY